mmetsp:Transcript_8475/g.17667  ORF Transcript_8475/g.17667 Transcript_8475/m.17667 type:complete len:398 (+) Transcript_8475:122-1315(+)
MVKIARRRRGTASSTGTPLTNILGRFFMAVAAVAVMYLMVFSTQSIDGIVTTTATRSDSRESSIIGGTRQRQPQAPPAVSHETPLAYGTKSLGEKTGELVEQAIRTGFRHIVTAGHHGSRNETGVGIGWKKSGIPRNELYLQTAFVPFGLKGDFGRDPSDPEELPASIEDQVKLSIETSLRNLQTDYVDAYIFFNNKRTIWNYDELLRAWKVMEGYAERGVLKRLGITSVHDPAWFDKFYNATTIKPQIVQNRFHSNRGYDVNMQETFAKYKNLQVQRFWLLNGSSGYGGRHKEEARAKGVTPAQLMLGFVMNMQETCLVGTTKLQHMKDDVEIAQCYESLFQGDNDENEQQNESRAYAKKLGMRQPTDRPLPGVDGTPRNSISSGVGSGRACRAAE